MFCRLPNKVSIILYANYTVLIQFSASAKHEKMFVCQNV